MRLVDAIEAELGQPMDTWPSSILQIIFAFDLDRQDALLHLQRIISFFRQLHSVQFSMPVLLSMRFPPYFLDRPPISVPL